VVTLARLSPPTMAVLTNLKTKLIGHSLQLLRLFTITALTLISDRTFKAINTLLKEAR
jgi:hypothetical protein